MNGRLLSINVSQIRHELYDGEIVATGIFKKPVDGRVPVRGVNARGDDQADRENHGGRYRALYAYASEDCFWWEKQLGRPLTPGQFGENLTSRDVDVSGALIGERWSIGSTVVQVTAPRVPCYKLGIAMNDQGFVREFAHACRPGAYLSIVTEGDIGPGDEIRIVSRPTHTLSIESMFHIFMFERGRLEELLVPELPPHWRTWVLERLGR